MYLSSEPRDGARDVAAPLKKPSVLLRSNCRSVSISVSVSVAVVAVVAVVAAVRCPRLFCVCVCDLLLAPPPATPQREACWRCRYNPLKPSKRSLEEILRSGAPWPSRPLPPAETLDAPLFSQARKPRPPISPHTPYTPQRRSTLSSGNRGLERAVREVQGSPRVSTATADRPRASPPSTPRRKTARSSLPTPRAKPFELRDEDGRAALSPRLNKWLTQQATGKSQDETAGGAAARKADIEAQRLREQQRQEAREREMNRCLVPLLRLIEETDSTALKSDATSALLSLALNTANASAFVKTGAIRTLLNLCSETDSAIRANVLAILSALAASPLTRRDLVEEGCVRAILPHTRLKNPDAAKFATGAILALCELEQNRVDMLADSTLVPALLGLLAPPTSRRATPRALSLRADFDPRLQRDAIFTLSLLVSGSTQRKLLLLEHGETVPVLLRVAADERKPSDIRLHALHSLETLLDVDGAAYPKQALDTFGSVLTHRTLATVLVRVTLPCLPSALPHWCC